ncbi:Ubiquinone biosynthesis protein COQ9, mitochondrial [Coccomyxa sp. Obi]|nr:Ubiquinone biosynthesis protein COQ9, mitochondrial [Coccomyxa sp. Obi]
MAPRSATWPGPEAYAHEGAYACQSGNASIIPEEEVEEPEEGEEGAEDSSAQELRGRLLEAALGHVNAKGWSVAALQSGAEDLQLSRSASGMISSGAAGLVEYFVEECNQQLASELESRQEELARMRTPERVRMAVRMRLEMLIPYIDTWPQALGIQAHPAHMATAVRQRAELADDIWHACGDTSTDYKWYTKRGLLAAVYAATELYMITDYSPGYADTWRALDRRLADVKRLGGAATEVRQAMNSLLANVGSMAEWAQDAVVQAQKRRQRS